MIDIPAFVRTDDKSFIRDTTNRALLNTDKAALERHRASRVKSVTFAQRINTLESEITELKQLVQQLLNTK